MAYIPMRQMPLRNHASAAKDVLSVKLFVNGRFLSQPLTGVQRYAAEMVSMIDQILGTTAVPPALRLAEWTLVAPPDADLSKLSLRHINARIVGRRSGHVWDQTDLLQAARRGTLLSLANSGPVLHPSQLVVLHDAGVFHRPEFFSWSYRTAHRSLGHLLARNAQIATVSNFSQRELASALGIPPGAIPVFNNSADHFARTVPDPGALTRIGLMPHRYFLLVGSMKKSKNVGIAVQAAHDLNRSDIPTVIVGDNNPKVFAQNVVSNDQNVIVAGRLRDEEIAALYANAAAFIFPSLYEGFGVPPLEAMAFGCPVIASTADAVREICGDAATYFDPFSADELRRCMVTRIAAGPASRDERRRQAMRVATYSWRHSASALLEFIAATKSPTS